MARHASHQSSIRIGREKRPEYEDRDLIENSRLAQGDAITLTGDKRKEGTKYGGGREA
jgi:hypothetical protein